MEKVGVTEVSDILENTIKELEVRIAHLEQAAAKQKNKSWYERELDRRNIPESVRRSGICLG